MFTTFYSDEETTLARYQHAPRRELRPGHRTGSTTAWPRHIGNDAARLAISGDNPMMLAAQDPAKVGRANKANSIAYKPALEKISNFDINWNIVAYPNPGLGEGQMFPDDPEPSCRRKSWQTRSLPPPASIVADPICRLERSTMPTLPKRSSWLNGERFSALHFTGPGTDLTVGLADGHEWHGGASDGEERRHLQSEHPDRGSLHHAARAARRGPCVEHQAAVASGYADRQHPGPFRRRSDCRGQGLASGEEVLNKVLDTDEGARRLGEVALVPHSSPISASGILFYNTLFDENASCHIALGQCYSKCFLDGASLSQDQIKAQGGNSSLIHIDWMIGSGEVDIDGVQARMAPRFR
ncbi:aminopeptidase [Rhizobium yanglingense]